MNPENIGFYIHEAIAAATILFWFAFVITICSVLS